ncbi:MAG: outer membrane beta-barrel protein, partial [Chitinophagaceae bacterium]|nr:outer membrane beta-barrel protein [Chitinophagaceae bacterium]
KNLLADMVEKVEALDEKSERAKRTGIRDAKSGKVINLRLKPDKNRGYFGSASAAAATVDRYDISGTLNYFKSERQLMTVLDVNDGGNLINNGTPLPNTKAMLATVNYADKLSKKTMLNVGYQGNGTKSVGEITTERQSFFSDSTLIQSHNSVNGADNQSHNLNIFLNYEIDTANTIFIAGSMIVNDNNNTSFEKANSNVEQNGINKPVNEAINRNNRDNKNTAGNINVNYIKVFGKRRRYLQANINSGFNQVNGAGELYSLTRFFNQDTGIADSSVRDQRSSQKGNGYSFNAGILYGEPLNDHSGIDFNYILNYANSIDDRLTLNYNTATGKYDSADSLATNYFKGNNSSHRFSLGYNYYKKKFQYQIGASMQKSTIANTNTAQGMGNYNQQMTNFFPRAQVMYMIDKRKMIHINYQGGTEQPTVEQLQPAPDYSNPLLIKRGNPDLKQSFRNEINVSYRTFRSENSSSLSAGIVINTFANQIMSSIITDERGIQVQQYLNTDGNYNIMANGLYSFPLSKTNRKANAAIGTNLGIGHSVSFVNGVENNTSSFIGNQSLKINYAPGEKLVTGFSGLLNWNKSKYSLQGSQKSSVLTHQYQADVSYEILPGLLVHSDINVLLNRSTPQLGGQDVTVWNARLSKMLFKRNGELKFTIYDILNNNKSIKQISADNYIERVETQVVQRIYMLSFTYRFRKFGI